MSYKLGPATCKTFPFLKKSEEALCDADQALRPDMFLNIMQQLRPLKSFLDNLPSVYEKIGSK